MSDQRHKLENFELDWEDEAHAVIQDIKRHVDSVEISKLPASNQQIYFNMTTLEKKDFCVELSPEGFRVVGEKYDTQDKKGKYRLYETPYSMLESMSPAYRDSFSEQLVEKLNRLQEERAAAEEEENSEQPTS